MVQKIGQHAVVIGDSIAGLLSARVLADFFENVTVVEREHSHRAAARDHNPRGQHAHAILARGEQILAPLFPGFIEELVAGGAFQADMGAAARCYQFGGYNVQHPTERNTCIQTHAYLDWHLRRRVHSLPNVRFLSGVTDVHPIVNGKTITGVEMEDGSGIHNLAADLSIGCAGRDSAAPRWLLELGFEPPPVSGIRVDLAGSIRYYKRAPELLPGAEMLLIYPKPPDGRKFAALLPVEGDRWVCMLGEGGSHTVPEKPEFLDLAKSLPVPDVYNVISRAEPLSAPVPFTFLGYLRRHFEDLASFPEGYLVMGEAVCGFNSVYCTSITSAALQAEVLSRSLEGGMDGTLAKRYFHGVGKAIDAPWRLSVGEDSRIPGAPAYAKPGENLFNGFLSLVRRAAARDTAVHDDLLDVMHLLSPMNALFQPATLARVLRANMTF